MKLTTLNQLCVRTYFSFQIRPVMARLAKLTVIFPLLLSLAHASIKMEICPNNPDPEKEADCCCNSLKVVSLLNSALAISDSAKDRALEIIIMRLDAIKCFEYYQLPKHLELLMPDSVPIPYHDSRKRMMRKKVHRRVKRQVSLGYPSNDKWEKIIPQLPQKGRHHYAPLGSHVMLKCYSSDDKEVGVQEEVVGDTSTFQWKHENGMEITAPLTSVDKKTGDLIFHRVRLADTSIYICTVTSQPDNGGDTRTTSYLSQLDVVVGSTFWLRFGMTFSTDKCRHKELIVIQQRVPDWVHQYVCHFCPVRNVSLTCMNFGEAGADEKYVQLTVAISTLGLEELLQNWSQDHVHCNIECQKRIHAKVLNITAGSILKLFNRRIEVRSIDGPTSVYKPLPNSHDEDLADACPPGFFLTYSLCFPCAPGSYSPTGPAECFPCATGFFQPNPGSSACFHCPEGKTTRKTGSLSQAECIPENQAGWLAYFAENLLMTIIIGSLLGILLLLWVLICCCCPRSCLGKLARCVPCCGEGEDGEERNMNEEKMKLTGGYTSEFDSDTSGQENSRYSRRVEFSEDVSSDGRGGYSSDDPDFRAEKSVRELIESTEEESLNPTIRPSSSAITLPEPALLDMEKSVRELIESTEDESLNPTIRPSSSAVTLPQPGRLDMEKYAYIQPMIPDPLEYRRREYCQTTLRNQQKQRKEEEEEARRRLARQAGEESQDENSSSQQPGKRGQNGDRSMPPPAFPRGDGDQPAPDAASDSSPESSGKKQYFARHPHLRLGNLLHKSKSLVAKLAEQKRKLRHLQPGSSSESTKSSKSSPRRKLLDKPKQPLSALKRKLKDKNVTISESRNTFHPKSIADTLPCTACKSDVVKNKSDDIVKSRSKKGEIAKSRSKMGEIGKSRSKMGEIGKSRSRRDENLNKSRSRSDEIVKSRNRSDENVKGRSKVREIVKSRSRSDEIVKSKSKSSKSRSDLSQKESKVKGIAASLSKESRHGTKSHTKRDRELIPEKSKPSSRTTVLTRGISTDRFQETMKKMQAKEAGSLHKFSKSKKRKK